LINQQGSLKKPPIKDLNFECVTKLSSHVHMDGGHALSVIVVVVNASSSKSEVKLARLQ
jgi:hypothetical protein